MTVHRLALFVGALAVAVGFVATAGATKPAAASGTVTVVDLSVTPIGGAGGNGMFHILATGTLDGTFAGTLDTDSIEVLHPTGNSTVRGTETCVCTVDGRTGTVVFRTEAKIVGDPFFYQDKKTVISTTGGLADLHGELSVRWDGGIATYTGSYHFDR
jgi:hypothetical protein